MFIKTWCIVIVNVSVSNKYWARCGRHGPDHGPVCRVAEFARVARRQIDGHIIIDGKWSNLLRFLWYIVHRRNSQNALRQTVSITVLSELLNLFRVARRQIDGHIIIDGKWSNLLRFLWYIEEIVNALRQTVSITVLSVLPNLLASLEDR